VPSGKEHFRLLPGLRLVTAIGRGEKEAATTPLVLLHRPALGLLLLDEGMKRLRPPRFDIDPRDPNAWATWVVGRGLQIWRFAEECRKA
jgi:hypothetical protein